MADLTIGGLTPTASVQLTDKVPKEPTAGPPAEYFLVSQLKTLLDTIYAPITGGAYVLKAGDTMTGLLTIAQATANTSNLILSGQSLTGANAQSLLDLAGTWNTSGSPNAINLVITNTASNGASNLLRLATSAATQFTVVVDGRSAGSISSQTVVEGFLTQANAIARTITQRGWAIGHDSFAVKATYILGWTTGSGSGADGGNIGLADIGLARNGVGILEVNSSVAGTLRDLRLRSLLTNNAAALVTSQVAMTDFAAAQLGTLTNSPTAGNPAKWIAFVDNGTTRYIPTWV